jgi:hypothetical protein
MGGGGWQMRRHVWAASLALAAVVASASAAATAQQSNQEASAARHDTLTFDGDVALLTVAIKPDKTADFEQVIAKLREGLMKSEKPERREQAKGWRVMRMDKPLPDGTIAYVHVISPVVAGADYTVMQILYDEFPDERQQLYELYRGAFAKNLALATGDVAIDMNAAMTPAVQAAAVGP